MKNPAVVILAAGLGTRLGRPVPKALTPLADGSTILSRQLKATREIWGEARIVIVVGFKMDLVMEASPDALFVYNDAYDRTNTAKSLQRAIELAPPGPLIWINGDVVLDGRLLGRLAPAVANGQTAVCVAAGAVADEEIKYTLDSTGAVAALSKIVSVNDAVGEAIGVNVVAAADRPILLEHLRGCANSDYFERGIETAIAAGLRVEAIDVAGLDAIEVDFDEDLAEANRRIRLRSQ